VKRFCKIKRNKARHIIFPDLTKNPSMVNIITDSLEMKKFRKNKSTYVYTYRWNKKRRKTKPGSNKIRVCETYIENPIEWNTCVSIFVEPELKKWEVVETNLGRGKYKKFIRKDSAKWILTRWTGERTRREVRGEERGTATVEMGKFCSGSCYLLVYCPSFKGVQAPLGLPRMPGPENHK
jgi:hypothetical protein